MMLMLLMLLMLWMPPVWHEQGEVFEQSNEEGCSRGVRQSNSDAVQCSTVFDRSSVRSID